MVRKGCSRFACERELGRPNINCNILTPLLWPSALCLSGSPGLLNRRHRAHSAGWWLSLLHLITIFSGPHSSGPQAPSAWCGFSNHISSITRLIWHSNSTAWLLSWPSYIIVQRPLDLWNRMFNRHQAEITVMQVRGHSLPVRQSMKVSWDFLACPILFANFRPRDFLS